jgi:hypothetical protein
MRSGLRQHHVAQLFAKVQRQALRGLPLAFGDGATQPRQISVRKALVYSVSARRRRHPGRGFDAEQRNAEVGQEQLHQQRRALEQLHIAATRRSAQGDLVRRATSSARPTSPPPMKAISDSTTVQRAASSRLRKMSQRRSQPWVTFPNRNRGPSQFSSLRTPDRQRQVDEGGDDEGLERAEVAALDQVGGVAQLLRGDLPAHGRAQHHDDDLADQRRPHLLERRRQHHAHEDLRAVSARLRRPRSGRAAWPRCPRG